jgi:16S rRNA (guanine1516-N2)-methyltransferase
MSLKVAILDHSDHQHRVRELAEQLCLPIIAAADSSCDAFLHFYALDRPDNQQAVALALSLQLHPNWQPFFLDFTSGALNWRREHGGGELLVRAVQGRKKTPLTIFDATAGLGRDSFILASHGFSLQMFERNRLVCALLDDALVRARLTDNPELVAVLANMSLHHADVKQAISDMLVNRHSEKPDVVYLDPMFPESKNSALVKKDMQIFHQLVGGDEDADELLILARQLASKRVVVKRPAKANFLADKKPDYQLSGKAIRFDVYLPV